MEQAPPSTYRVAADEQQDGAHALHRLAGHGAPSCDVKSPGAMSGCLGAGLCRTAGGGWESGVGGTGGRAAGPLPLSKPFEHGAPVTGYSCRPPLLQQGAPRPRAGSRSDSRRLRGRAVDAMHAGTIYRVAGAAEGPCSPSGMCVLLPCWTHMPGPAHGMRSQHSIGSSAEQAGIAQVPGLLGSLPELPWASTAVVGQQAILLIAWRSTLRSSNAPAQQQAAAAVPPHRSPPCRRSVGSSHGSRGCAAVCIWRHCRRAVCGPAKWQY